MPLDDATRARLPERLRHFTDREAQIAAFDALWGAGEWVLVFHGLSGNGKTTLIDFLVETRCRPQGIPYTWLDFGGTLGVNLRADFRALADALAHAPELALPGQAVRAYEARRDRAWELLQTRKLHVQAQASMYAADRSEISDSSQVIRQDVANAIRQMEREARSEIGAGLVDALAQPGDRPAVIFLDTYELLAEAADQEQAAWLWEVLGQFHARCSRLRVVVGGRREMADLEARHGRQRELEALSAEDSDQLLRRMGIDDPAWRAAVYDRLANGHPLLTEMAGELWKAAKEAGDPLPAGDIPHLAGHERAVDWLTGRILDRLVEPLKGAGRWAALLRRFDADVLRACLDPGLPPLGEDDYERLRRFSFVERARGGAGYACHDLLRRVQTHYLHDNEPAAFRAFHARAAAYFAPSDDLEALYHRLALAEEAAFDEWQGAVNEAEFAWDWPRWGGLLDLAGSPELPLTEAQQGRVWEKRAGWRYRRGQPEAALEALRHAIDLLERVGDQLGVAMAYNNIGEVYRAQGEYAQALEWYGKSVAITEKLGDQAGLAPTYNNIGFVYKARGEYDQALEWYGKSATITEKLGDQASLATIYNNVGVAYKSRGEYAQALEWYGKSVAITEQLGDHFMQAASYNNIGAVYFARGDYDQALEWYRKSVTILEKLGDQAGLATAYNNVGEVYRARGDYDQALEWHVKGLSITEKLGDQAGLARSYNNIAFVHYVRGEFGATVAMLERSLAIFERIGARANADTVRANLEQVKQETRNGWRD